jgi:D-3-phosphoglycerate dehydrogenase
VIAYTPRLRSDSRPNGVRAAQSREELLAAADYDSLHAPSTPETRGLIGEAEIRAMKSSAYLINTSRGALVDENALARALTEGRIAGAALDVLSQEPPSTDHPLLGLDSVIVTPHAAFYSDTAIAELQATAARNVAEVLSGRVPKTVVNPKVLDLDCLRLRLAG